MFIRYTASSQSIHDYFSSATWRHPSSVNPLHKRRRVAVSLTAVFSTCRSSPQSQIAYVHSHFFDISLGPTATAAGAVKSIARTTAPHSLIKTRYGGCTERYSVSLVHKLIVGDICLHNETVFTAGRRTLNASSYTYSRNDKSNQIKSNQLRLY